VSCFVILFAQLLGGAALAFQGAADLPRLQPPARLRTSHSAHQQRLRGQRPWQDFLEAEGSGWLARFDEHTGRPHRAWGPGIELGLGQDAGQREVAAALLQLLGRHEALLGVPVEQLVLARAVHVESSDHWILRFDQVAPAPPDGSGALALGSALLDERDLAADLGPMLHRGSWSAQTSPVDPAPWHALRELVHQGEPTVWGGQVQVHLRLGRLVMLGIDTYPDAQDVDTGPGLAAQSAVEIAVDEGPLPEASHEVEGAALVILPVLGSAGLEQRLCWAVRTRTRPERGDPPGIWLSFVDAHSGELLGVENQVRFASGAIYGVHDTRTVDGDTSTSALAYLELESELASGVTGLDGSYELEGESLEIDQLAGTYFQVRNRSGAYGSATWTDGDLVLTDEDATQAEIDSYVFLSQVRAWALEHAPDLDIVHDVMTSNVNISSSCNAYYDGAVNFFTAGGGCNNTGRIADVNYHEWGHGLHAYAAGTWYVDGSVGEAAGDITAFLQTGDHIIAPEFSTSGSGIRDVSPDRVYPDDWVGEVHYDGLIFGGAVWDLLELFREEMSEDDARYLVAELFIEALRANPETDETYDAFIAADDDNGDLGDGTPNMCAIIEAFTRHGLGPAGSSSVLQLDSAPKSAQVDAGDRIVIEASLVNLAPTCVDSVMDEAEVVYSVDRGASWATAELEVTGTTLTGSIPMQAEGTVVHYYLRAESGESEVTAPVGGERTPFSVYVGGLEPLWCNDFERDKGDFEHQSIAGVDDWSWGEPPGIGGDPATAASGSLVWGNDLGSGLNEGEYQNNAHNLLESPIIDTAGHSEVIVQFSRWLQVEDGYYDQAYVLANGEVIWANHATDRYVGDEHHRDEQWVTETFALVLGDEEGLTLGWEIVADGGLTFGGWNIDDVCVYAPSAPEVDTGDPGGEEKERRRCGCASQAAPLPAALLAPLGLLGLALRRRWTYGPGA